MGFTASSASTLLAACGGGDDDGETATRQPATSAAPAGATTTVPAVPTEAVNYPGRTGTLMGAYARAATARGAVLVIHENRGLNDHIRSVVGRLAASGYSALAVDLLSAEGGSAKVGEANAGAALNGAPAGHRGVVTDCWDAWRQRRRCRRRSSSGGGLSGRRGGT